GCCCCSSSRSPGAGRGNRTHMVLPPADFESAASTSSAIPAAEGRNYTRRIVSLSIDDFDYALPQELIAQHPGAVRHESRLLHLEGDALADGRFTDLPDLLAPGDLLVAN